jgi:hypothetical protein
LVRSPRANRDNRVVVLLAYVARYKPQHCLADDGFHLLAEKDSYLTSSGAPAFAVRL